MDRLGAAKGGPNSSDDLKAVYKTSCFQTGWASSFWWVGAPCASVVGPQPDCGVNWVPTAGEARPVTKATAFSLRAGPRGLGCFCSLWVLMLKQQSDGGSWRTHAS